MSSLFFTLFVSESKQRNKKEAYHIIKSNHSNLKCEFCSRFYASMCVYVLPICHNALTYIIDEVRFNENSIEGKQQIVFGMLEMYGAEAFGVSGPAAWRKTILFYFPEMWGRICLRSQCRGMNWWPQQPPVNVSIAIQFRTSGCRKPKAFA